MLQVCDRRKITKSEKITVDMWGKTGIITEVKVNRYFLKFWVPNRCVGLWVTEKQVEEV